ncbi:MAG: DUF3617 domain-containing protein [Terriglobales bacterium]|jgi:hypothetical protein
MRTKLICCLIALLPLPLLAADKPTMLNVKEGLWEVTVTHPSNGLPGMPEDALAKLPPDQRARVEEMMKQKGMTMSGNTTVVKSCVTREKIEKGMAFAAENEKREGNCTHTTVSSSPTHFEAKYHCDESGKDGKKTTVDGTTTVEVVNADTTKGSSHMVSNSDGRIMNMDFTFTSKYLGSACGDIK